jgi:hypothetical protein
MRIAKYGVIAGVVIAMLAVNVEAAFIVETDVAGLANANYIGDGIPSSAAWPSPSRALGVTAPSAVFGGTGERVYVFSYTPSPIGCLDVDNVTFSPGADLLDVGAEPGQGIASGKAGGGTGLYNVYATWRASENVSDGGVAFTITSEGDDVVLPMVQQRTSLEAAGSDNWLLIAERIPLVTGRTYTVTQVANDPVNYVSMRSHGVLWEFVEAEEPLADVVAAGGVISVEEGGDTDQYTIVLKEQPPEAIVITAEACEPNEITLNGQGTLELTFTAEDWDIERVVDVVAIEDTEAEPGHSLWIMHMTYPADANDIDPNSVWADGFAGLVTVDVRDYDVPGVRITETGTTAVSEEGPTWDDYAVKLLFPPTGAVTVKIATDGQTVVDIGLGEGETAELVFTPDNWQDDQTVTVIAVDDDELEHDHSSTITHSVESDLDGGYDGIPARDVLVAVEDNECGVWGYSLMDLNDDCFVDLGDLAKLAELWMECTQPYGEGCIDLR